MRQSTVKNQFWLHTRSHTFRSMSARVCASINMCICGNDNIGKSTTGLKTPNGNTIKSNQCMAVRWSVDYFWATHTHKHILTWYSPLNLCLLCAFWTFIYMRVDFIMHYVRITYFMPFYFPIYFHFACVRVCVRQVLRNDELHLHVCWKNNNKQIQRGFYMYVVGGESIRIGCEQRWTEMWALEKRARRRKKNIFNKCPIQIDLVCDI